MTKTALGWIENQLTTAGINYEFGQWGDSPIPDPYFVGENLESPAISEDGLQDSTLILTGTSKSTFLLLETAKETIKSIFPTTGTTAILSNGNGIVVSYSDSLNVPVDDGAIKRIQINLTIKEWSVN